MFLSEDKESDQEGSDNVFMEKETFSYDMEEVPFDEVITQVNGSRSSFSFSSSSSSSSSIQSQRILKQGYSHDIEDRTLYMQDCSHSLVSIHRQDCTNQNMDSNIHKQNCFFLL